MASPWPPPRDLDLAAAGGTFAEKIAADPARFDIDPATAAVLVAAAAAFSAALAEARAPSTNSRTVVAAKNMARHALLKIMRQVGGRVRTTPGLGPDDFRSLGMVVPDRIKTPIAAPAAQAAISIERIDRLAHEIRVIELGSTRRGLPRGCVGYAAFAIVHPRGEPPSLDERDCRFAGIATRPVFRITYRPADAGKQATIFVRYLNRKGQLGPPSAVATCMVAA